MCGMHGTPLLGTFPLENEIENSTRRFIGHDGCRPFFNPNGLQFPPQWGPADRNAELRIPILRGERGEFAFRSRLPPAARSSLHGNSSVQSRDETHESRFNRFIPAERTNVDFSAVSTAPPFNHTESS